MGVAQALGKLASRFVEQAALGHEGLVEVPVRIQQQADSRQIAIGQASAGVGHLTDTLDAEAADEHQQTSKQQDWQSNLPAKTEIGK